MGARQSYFREYCCSNDNGATADALVNQINDTLPLSEHNSLNCYCEEEQVIIAKNTNALVGVEANAYDDETCIGPTYTSMSSVHSTSSRMTTATSADSEAAQASDDSLGHPHRGVSVQHMRKTLPRHIANAGLTCEDCVYAIEKDVIRAAGVDTTCPRDGRLGAAYVDCISGYKHAGLAHFMLSYTWGYKLQDIIDTLHEFCMTREISKTRTYIWICCLCINQHRVQENQSPLPFHTFRDEFKARVLGIGKVIAMVLPWQEPIYIKRAWCIFEMYTAVTEELQLELAMPHRESISFCESLDRGTGIHEMWVALTGLDVREASAYMLSDRINIMQMIENEVGFANLNTIVSECLTRWTMRVAHKHMDDLCLDSSADGFSKASSCLHVGRLHYMLGHLDNAVAAYTEGLRHGRQDGVLETLVGAELFIGIAQVEREKGNYTQQLRNNTQAKDILTKIGKLCTNEGAHLLWSMATYYKDEIGDLDKSQQFYEQAKHIREMRGTLESHEGAWIEWGIADVIRRRGDMQTALEGFIGVSRLLQSIDCVDTPCGAWVAFSIAHIHLQMGQLDMAEEAFQDARMIREKIGSLRAMDGALVLLALAETQKRKMNTEDAMENFLMAEDIAKEKDMMEYSFFSLILNGRSMDEFKKQLEELCAAPFEAKDTRDSMTSRGSASKLKCRSFSFLSNLTKSRASGKSDFTFSLTQSNRK